MLTFSLATDSYEIHASAAVTLFTPHDFVVLFPSAVLLRKVSIIMSPQLTASYHLDSRRFETRSILSFTSYTELHERELNQLWKLDRGYNNLVLVKSEKYFHLAVQINYHVFL